MTGATVPDQEPAAPAGRGDRCREHDRIRAVYRYYDSSEAQQRKRDSSNPGVRLNAETRWLALQQVLRNLNLAEGFRVLDVGCGAGQDLQHIAQEFAPLRPSLYGIDLLPDRIERARRTLPAATLCTGGAESLPWDDGWFDVVLASTVFSSILDSRICLAVAAEMARTVAPDGIILCYDMRFPSPANPNVRAIGARELQRLFPRAHVRLQAVTLVPPLARRLGGLAGAAYAPLHALHPLRSHYLAEIRPAVRPGVTRCPYRGQQLSPASAVAGRAAPGRGGVPERGERIPGRPGARWHSLAAGNARRLALHVALTLGGLGCERALAFLAVTLILRTLPESQGGAFVLMLKVAGFTGVLSTLGLQTGAVRLISSALGEGRDRWAAALLRAFLATRLGMALVLIAAAILLSKWIAAHVFGHPAVAGFVQWGCVSAATNALLMFSLHHLQARQYFARYTVLTILTSATRMAAIVFMVAAGVLSAYRAALLWALLPALLAAIGLFLAPRDFLERVDRRQARRAMAELINLGRWLTVSSLIAIVFTNLDSLLVVRYLGLTDADWYGAAVNLSLVVVMVATALVTVLLPAVSRLSELQQIRRFFWRSLFLTGAGAVLMLPAVAAAPWLVETVYGSRFLGAVPAFRILFAGALLTVIYATTAVVFLALRKPAHLAGQALAQVVASVPCYLLLIPREGILGGAVGTFAGQVAGLLYVLCVAPVILRDGGGPVPGAGKPGYAS